MPTSGDLLIDPFYGHIYNKDTVRFAENIYGLNDVVPIIPSKDFSNYGLLRIPFKAIARHFVSSRSEFYDAFHRIRDAAAITSSWRAGSADHWQYPLLLRGQTAEYVLPRPKEGHTDFLNCFYGDPHAFEPSLISSSERRGGRQPQLEALWGVLVNAIAIFQDRLPKEPDEISIFKSKIGDLVKLSLAQHYGLPTPAVDVTTDLLTAMWFALHKLDQSTPGHLNVERIGKNDVAVMYVFDVPPGWAFTGIVSDFPAIRPSRQHGAFIPFSWGYRRNRAARFLVGALYFHGQIADEFLDDLPSESFLFPNAAEDPIIDAVERYAVFGHGNHLMDDLKKHLFYVS